MLLPSTDAVRDFAPITVLTSSNAVPHFFPGVKTEVFHGFDAGKPRHIYIRGFFDLYCTTGPRDTRAFERRPASSVTLPCTRPAGRSSIRSCAHTAPISRRPCAPAGDPLSLDVLAVVERRADPLRDDPRSVADRPLAVDRDTASEVGRDGRALSRSAGRALRFATEDNILDLFPQVDMMISDTSSALNEFLLTYKPVITFKNRRPGRS